RRQNSTPYLGDLPLLGALFRERVRNGSRRELVVLLTPRIWNPHGPPAAPYLGPPPFLAADLGTVVPISPGLPDLSTQARPPVAPAPPGPPLPPGPGLPDLDVQVQPPAAPVPVGGA